MLQELEINALVFSLKGIMFGSNCAVAWVANIAPTTAQIATHHVQILNNFIVFLALHVGFRKGQASGLQDPLAQPATS